MFLRANLIVLILGLGQIVAFASSYYLLGVLADPMAQDLSLRPTSLFTALSVAFLISAVLTPRAGRLIERHGGRRVLCWAHVFFPAALLTMAVAGTSSVLLTGVAALGVGMATGLYGTAFAFLVELHGTAARKPITAVSLLGALGGGLGWPLSRLITEAWDWRAACIVWALGHLVLCLPLTYFGLPRARPFKASIAASTDPIRWDRRMVQIAGVFAGGWMVSTAMGAHLPRLLGQLGLGVEQAAWAAGLMAASAIGARLVDLIVLHRTHPVATVRWACMFHPTGAVLAVLGGVRLAPLLAVGQGAGNGLLSVASGVLPLQVFGPERYAVRQALLLTPARYLQAVAPAGYALALDASLGTALTLSSLVCIAMFALTFGLNPSPR
ncbi:MFS transporter [uncultured Brevundimonas sp.]|uniref:MFS transporter n=1 Tax=uncultured Brevundimonas sp. TaxID=213418 RepID=UPI0030EF25CF|tara:strand:+ start:1798 stop:2946 length:1149 start_codon:yes stop_codon:yes gene_type:complete